MITLNEIRILAKSGKFEKLRLLHDKAKKEGIESCDKYQLSTINLAILNCSIYGIKSQAHLRCLLAMLDAIDRGSHPYDDITALGTLQAEATIAQAQLSAHIKKS